MQLGNVLHELEQLAPPRLAESWDNTGLLWGETTHDVSRVMTCLTLTPDVAAEAIEAKANLIVTHHPMLFKAVQRVTSSTAEGQMLLQLSQQGIAVYSPHTSWDNAPQGINALWAHLFHLQDVRPLRANPAQRHCKVVTCVPQSALPAVQQAVWEAGGGIIGDYRCCSYYGTGTGTFQGNLNSHPAVGQAGQFEEVPEFRLEFICPLETVSVIVANLRRAHPYEEPGIDIYPLEPLNPKSDEGAGRFGSLETPCSLAEFAQRVQSFLTGATLQVVGDPHQNVKTVGIACGAAADYLSDAQRANCDVFLTGEARFHACLDARQKGIGLLLCGHYASERLGLEHLARLLAERLPSLTVWASERESDPLWTVKD